LLKRLVFIAYIDIVLKKTIYHRKNKPSIALKKKKIILRGALICTPPPWKNPGYGPAFVLSFKTFYYGSLL